MKKKNTHSPPTFFMQIFLSIPLPKGDSLKNDHTLKKEIYIKKKNPHVFF